MCLGTNLPLPDEIAAGLHDTVRRAGWNRPASPGYALPTETWREHVARRTRYEEVRAKLAAGEVCTIDDLVTYNLDLRRFAEDAIRECEGPETLRAFYHAIEKVTVLDPTCGSGAFLFAALNILEPLYDACLDRMQGFVDDLDRIREAAPTETVGAGAYRHTPSSATHTKKYDDFRKVLARIDDHPSRSRDYYIHKSIIVNNLYGVDIMEEAVEICKLRLFLTLVARLERPEEIEPLPDIDFNIRAGNTLVGYASYDELQQALGRRLDFDNVVKGIKESAEIADRAFQMFHHMQTEEGMDAGDFTAAKREVRARLDRLRTQLDHYLAIDYGQDPDDQNAFAAWRASHQPFHWFSEFYGIMARNRGFDIVIGNPPWKEYSAVKKDYTVRNYATESCGNLHGLCTERALNLCSPNGRTSFIVQLPLANSSRMASVRNLLNQRSSSLFVMTFDDRPGKLFEGLQHCRSAIFISRKSSQASDVMLATTRYQRWPTVTRPCLFMQVEYAQIIGDPIFSKQFPKYANTIEESLFRKVKLRSKQGIGTLLNGRRTNSFVFYQEATQYWVKATVGLPYYAKDGIVGVPAHGRYLYFDDAQTAHAVSAILNSSLFYAYFIAYGDCFHLSDGLATGFPLTRDIVQDGALCALNERLMRDLRTNAETKTISTSDGHKITYAEFYGTKSKSIIDEIDRVLAQHYGFTDEELDFIINYDIKYRMGQGAEAEDEA